MKIEKKKLIKRDRYLNKIKPFIDVDLIKVLTGSRRSGKSMILYLIIEELLSNGVKEDDIIFINFEDSKYENINDYKKLNDFVIKNKGKDEKQYLFFDEIQHVSHFEKAINSFRVSFNCSIFITGSNSKMLSSEISTILTGRTIQFTIYPFSYSEAIDYVKKFKKDSIDFENYFKYGGYPLRFDLPDSNSISSYIKQLFMDICEKDIFARDTSIEKSKFYKIAKYCLLYAGNEFNPATIYNYLKSNNKGKEYCALSSIYNFLDKMEKSFLLKPVYRYNISGKEVLKSNPRYYAIDNGMRYINTINNKFDIGKFLENIVLIELLSRGYEVYVGKTYKGEVDFVACMNGKKCFIQVSYLMNDESTIKREFGAFSSIKDASPKYVLSLDQIDLSRDGIVHLNIVDLLLHKKELFIS